MVVDELSARTTTSRSWRD